MRLLCDAASGHSSPSSTKSLALLGVGNGNDVALDRLTQQYGRIGLVDLDTEALDHLTGRYPAISDRLQVFGEADVSGILEWLADRGRTRTPQEIAQTLHSHAVDPVIERARLPTMHGPAQPWGCPYDVVASLTLLSQLIDTAKMVLGDDHPRLWELILALRDGHWQRICQMLRPGGKAVLITDFVSSVTCPTLSAVAEDVFPEFVAGLIQQRNFFTGANPFAIQQRLLQNPQLAPLVQDVHVSLPWRWDLGPKAFAVAAITATRSCRKK